MNALDRFLDALKSYCNGNVHLATIMVTWAIQSGSDNDDDRS